MTTASHVIGFDDAPFADSTRGDVMVIGAVFCNDRLEGVVRGRVRRDGANATAELARLVSDCRFRPHLQAILLQGIALAGFNVVDLPRLRADTGIPVLVVSRHQPDLLATERALRERVPGGERKWRRVQRAGLPERVQGVWVQRAGLSPAEAAELIRRFAVNSRIPEPLRTAHLIAGGVARGESRHRV